MNNFYDTRLSNSQRIKAHVESALPTIGKIRRLTELKDQEKTYLSKLRTAFKSPMDSMYAALMSNGYMNNLVIHDFGRSTVSVPEVLASPSLVFDLKPLNYSKNALQAMHLDNYENKAIINITPYVVGRSTGKFHVGNISDIQDVIVRTILCMKYHDSTTFLPASASEYLVGAFATALSKIMHQKLHLSLDESQEIRIAIGVYIASQLDAKVERRTPYILSCKSFGDPQDIDMIDSKIRSMTHTIDGRVDIKTLCAYIRTVNEISLRDFKEDEFYRYAASLSQDYVSSFICADYPPYFAHLMLKTITGNYKCRFKTMMEEARLYKDIKFFADDIEKNIRTFRPRS